MCLICTGVQNQTLTFQEAWRNLGEYKNSITRDHLAEVRDMVLDGLYEEEYCLYCEESPCYCDELHVGVH